MRMFHSSFIVDVQTGSEGAILTDSQRLRFIVDPQNAEAMATFKLWFRDVFAKGVPQRPTVIEYSQKDDGGAVELHVVKIITMSVEQ